MGEVFFTTINACSQVARQTTIDGLQDFQVSKSNQSQGARNIILILCKNLALIDSMFCLKDNMVTSLKPNSL